MAHSNYDYSTLAPLTLATAIVLAGGNLWLRGAEPFAWVLGGVLLVAVLALAWVLLAQPSRELRGAVTGAAAIISASLLAALSQHLDLLSADQAERAMGVVFGAILMIVGNRLPRKLMPLAQMDCDPAAAERIQRRAGWALFLAGVGYALAWLVLPLAWAPGISVGLGILALTVIAIMARGLKRDHGMGGRAR